MNKILLGSLFFVVALTSTALPAAYPLHEAAQLGKITQLRTLLGGNVYDINARDENGLTALHWAALTDHLDCVQLLLQSGAKCGKKTNEGQTAKDIAQEENHDAIAELLQNWEDFPEIKEPEAN